MAYEERFMKRAAELSIASIENGGGPFGAVIVKSGEIIAESSNSVTKDNDPTAHAEVNTIRKACKQLNTFDLTGCEIYSSCEPCPMCLSAIYWAHIDTLYFGNTKLDAANIGFDDSFIYNELDLPIEKRAVKSTQCGRELAIKAFELWQSKTDKIEY